MLKKGSRRKFFITVLLGSTIALSPLSSALAADVTVGWDPEKVIITNNVGKPDSVKVSGLPEGAIVKVYDKATGGKLIGTAVVQKGQTEAIVTIPSLDATGGKVYVSVTLETAAIEKEFDAEAKTTKPAADKITATNNVGKADSVLVEGLTAGTIVKVYDKDGDGKKQLGTATVAANQTSATVSVTQLGVDAGKAYVSTTVAGQAESDLVEVSFTAEAVSAAPKAEDIEIVNNAVIADTVTVSKLAVGDIVKVYEKGKTTVLGTATVATGKAEAIVSIKQLGADAGSVEVSVTSKEKLESEKVEKAFAAEGKTAKPAADKITATNNVGKADSVLVEGLTAGTIVKVYDKDGDGKKQLGTATVAANQTSATVSVTQLGVDAGKAYVSTTVAGQAESDLVEVSFTAEAVSAAPKAEDIEIVNNAVIADTVTVSKLAVGDIVKVYEKGKTTVLGTATVATGKAEAVVSIKQLGADAGAVEVSVTSKEKLESEKVEKAFAAEGKTAKPAADKITATNNVGKADSLLVEGLTAGTIVKVYDKDGDGKKQLGTAMVAANQTSATVSVTQLGVDAGKAYVSTTVAGQAESDLVEVSFTAEAVSAAPKAEDIEIVNNAVIADTVTVSKLAVGDIVKVYEKGKTTVLGTATVATGKAEAVVSIKQLGADAGAVEVSVTSKEKLESEKVEKAFAAEGKTAKPAADKITATNNVGKADSVLVEGLTAGTIVKVYDKDGDGKKQLGTATVAANQTSATVSVTQLGVDAGKAYVSTTVAGQAESDLVEVSFTAEAVSAAPKAEDIEIVNNAVIADTVTVSKLAVGDIVKVYEKGKTTVLGTATVATGKAEAVVSIKQLGADAGSVEVSVTSKEKLESEKVEKAFAAEGKTAKPAADKITATNNVGKADSVLVEGLTAGTIVKVYDKDGDGKKQLGTATVAANQTSATVSVTQLGVDAGKAYVSTTVAGQAESDLVEVSFTAEAVSAAPKAEDIEIVNNAVIADTVTVSKLAVGDIVKVYEKGKTTVLGTATVATGKAEAVVSIKQLGADAGSVEVSVTSKEKLESEKVEKAFAAEGKTAKPAADKITATNNVGKADSVLVEGLTAGTIVKVYDKDGEGKKQLGTATVAANQTSATVSVTQLGVDAGKAYVSTTVAGQAESDLVEVSFTAEAVSAAPKAEDIEIVNNAVIADTVTVSKLAVGDIVKVYEKGKTTVLGTATVATGKAEAVVSIKQLGADAGSVEVSVTSKEKLESEKVEKAFAAEGKTAKPAADKITATNNVGKADSVLVEGLTAGTIVKVYDKDGDGKKQLGTATVAANQTSATVSVTQLGVDAGKAYVSTTVAGQAESDLVEVSFTAEAVSAAPKAEDIEIVNNAVIADTVTVSKLAVGDIVKVYEKGKTTVLGTATVATGKAEAVVSIKQLGADAGSVEVSVTSKEKLESEKVEKAFAAEGKTAKPAADKITATNNVGKADSVLVEGLTAGTIVKVYDKDGDGKKQLGTATVAANQTSATVSVTQLGVDAGKAYVSTTVAGQAESDLVEVSFTAEAVSAAPKAEDIEIVNNAVIADTVTVSKLAVGDIVKVYEKGKTTVLGTATVATGKAEAVVSIKQLGADAGSVEVSVTSKEKLESEKVEKAFAAEGKTAKPAADKITATNNVGKADSVLVEGLTAGTIVKVYDKDGDGKKQLGTATVAANQTSATVSVTQLGVDAGKAYVSTTVAGQAESDLVEVSFTAEAVSAAPKAEDIEIVNNAGIADTVKVGKLAAGDIVKVYKKGATATSGTATVATGKEEVTVSIAQLGAEAGSVEVTVTSKDKRESEKVEKAYAAEGKSTGAKADKVEITNLAGKSDTIKVSELTAGTVVKVYDKNTSDKKQLGTATVATGQTSATVTVSQLSVDAGKVFVSITEAGQAESDLVEVSYAAEAKSTAPAVGDITIVNNAGLADTVKVEKLASSDVVKVYKKGTTTVLGTATVVTGKSEVSINIAQIGSEAGSVEISVTSSGKLESEKVEKTFEAEQTTDKVIKENVVVTNNVGKADTVLVKGLKAGEIVKVYDKASAGAKILGTATVASGKDEVTISINNLGAAAGSIYIIVIETGKKESEAVEISYSAEG
ncbi:hypothetical protein [Paenibacillus sp. RC67]|uniref:hypothetical protein n=1 Tax=Paenibacillus sp. RC67 TaxID=3039392 RepID=UPI0024ADD7DB|nr:hypothetical protein [Paenibacillus sp. RC67]